MAASIGTACSIGNTCCAAEPSTNTNTACWNSPIPWTRPSTACATASKNTISSRIRFCNSAYNLLLFFQDQIVCSPTGPSSPGPGNAPKEVLYGLDEDAQEDSIGFRFGRRPSAIGRRGDCAGGRL